MIWINKLRIYTRMAILCLKSTRRLNIGDVVIYRGKRWFISNGVTRPSWSLAEVGGDGYEKYVHESEFRKERSFGNVMHDLNFTWSFYKGYWFDIWLRALNGDVQSREALRHMPVKN